MSQPTDKPPLPFTRGATVRTENTGRRRAEASLRRAEEHFDQLVSSVRDYAIFLLDAEGNVLTWNQGAERITGYLPREIIGQSFSRFYTPEGVARGWPVYELEQAKLQGRFEDEGWRVRKDGTRFWANVVVTTLHGDQGEVRGFLEITRDLTEHRRAEDALRQSEERFRLLIEGVQDYAIFMLDVEGRITTWNAGAERIKGYTPQEIIGKHFSVFYAEEAKARHWPDEELRLARAHGRFEDEGWRVRKDGTTFWANVVITALRDSNGQLRGFSKVTRDLTERRANEEALRTASVDLEQRVVERTRELTATNETLRQEIERRQVIEYERAQLSRQLEQRVTELATADRHKNEFLAMLGHELRNPLAPIRNALEILKAPHAPSEMQGEARSMIERQVHHLVRLVDDLLDVSRIMQGKIDLRRERLDLRAVIARAVETAQPAIDANGHQLVVEMPDEHVDIDGDLVRLGQVLSNLLVNAAKYTEAAGRIEVSVAREGSCVAIRVRDNGIGIAPELLPRIFDFFVQGSRTLARSQGGIGIGLTLVRRITEMHGGEVMAESAGPGKGSVFTVWLPLAPPRDVGDALARNEDPMSLPTARLRVLVVDDNVDAAESTASLVAIWGYETRTLHDGGAVLPAVQAWRPHVVLLDIGLPGKNGYDVAAELHALADNPVRLLVAMTGYGQEDDRRRSQAAGFDLHLTKPLDPMTLRATLAQAADGRLAERR